jgi:hypothetical protein
MPCYTVRTVSVEFKVGNVDLLKRAIEKIGWVVSFTSEKIINARTDNRWGDEFTISFDKGLISSQSFDAKKLNSFSNQLKRAYSEVVIDEVAKKNKWIKKTMGAGQFQLQRF